MDVHVHPCLSVRAPRKSGKTPGRSSRLLILPMGEKAENYGCQTFRTSPVEHKPQSENAESWTKSLRIFLIESNENLDRLDQELVKLESEPSSKAVGQHFPHYPHHQGQLRISGVCPPGESGACGGEPALAFARREAHAEPGHNQRTAGHGRCGAPHAGRDSVHRA